MKIVVLLFIGLVIVSCAHQTKTTQTGSWEVEPPEVLEPKGFDGVFAGETSTKTTNLKLLSSKKNKITDDVEWMNKYGYSKLECYPSEGNWREVQVCPNQVPRSYQGYGLIRGILGERGSYFVYGRNPNVGHLVIVSDKAASRFIKGYDFQNFITPKNVALTEFTSQSLNWADQVENILYVSLGHNTYAKSSNGKNAYVHAIDLTTNTIQWSSEPLTSNANNFVITNGVMVTGYGFTAEPDFVFTIDLKSGRRIQKIPVKSGPSHFVAEGPKVFARTYDRDIELEFK